MTEKSAALIFLGATEFSSNKLTSRQAFENSKNEVERYFNLQSNYKILEKLDLFGSRESASQQVTEVDKFVKRISSGKVEYLFLLYFGHGIIRANKDDYFWAIATTNDHNQYASAIDVNTLGHSLKKLRSTTKCICIVDCCFSAATASALQSGQALDSEVNRRTKASIAKANESLIISSSAIDNVSYISGVEEKTLFGRAIMAVLTPESIEDGVTNLDAASLIDRCEQWMEQEEPDRKTSPQLIVPFQKGGLLIKEELFPITKKKAAIDPVLKVDLKVKPAEIVPSEFYPSRDELDEIRDIVRLGQELEKELVLSIDKSLLKEDLYAYYARTKGVESVARKIERKRATLKREGKSGSYGVSDVTDVVGLRLITLFRDDIAGILHGLCNILVGTNGQREEFTRYNPFTLPPEIREARAYFSETFPGAQGYAVEAKEILSSYFEKPPHNIRAEIIPKDEYSSVHIVLRTKLGKTNASDETPRIVTVEFQIRSVFEDTWAQVDHKLRYTKTRVSSNGEAADSFISEREDIPPSAERSLKLLKRFLDNSGDLAEIIRAEVENTTPEFSKPTPSMDSAEDFAHTVVSLGADPEDFDSFRSILLKKDELDVAYKKLGSIEAADRRALEKLRKDYGKLAEDLNGLFEAAESRERFIRLDSADEATRFYFYSLRMEEAFCRVFSARPGDLSEVREARGIYTQLVTDFSGFAPLHYRMAQALKSTGDLPRAIKSMQKAIQCIENGEYLDGKFDHRLTKKQFETLIDNVDRILGYYVWARANIKLTEAGDNLDAAVTAETLQAYDEAIGITMRGLERSSPDMRQRTLNNIVAYLNDAISLRGGSIDGVRDFESMAERSYEDLFHEFASLVSPAEEVSIKRLETLATGYSLLGRSAEASSCSRRIISVITKNKLIASGEIPADEIQEILDIALELRDSD